jgi:plasmid replication initiation protein
MGDLVVKDNSLVQASYSLGLVEARLILLAIVEARETGLGVTPNTFLEIRADHYAERFGVEKHTAYKVLADAVLTLFNRQVTLHTTDQKLGLPERQIVRWVSGISYVEGAGVVKIRFAPDVVPLITRLEENFTWYELEQVAGLQSAYATRLYELIIQWRSTGKTPMIELGEFKNQMGVGVDEYPRVFDFKKRVLDLAVKQINEHTDIKLEYEQSKKGKNITGFTFKFKQKTKPIEAPQKPKKTDTPKASTSFIGLQLVLLNQIQKNHPEITEKYVRDYAEQSGLDIVQVLEKIKADYKAAEEFSLEKSD